MRYNTRRLSVMFIQIFILLTFFYGCGENFAPYHPNQPNQPTDPPDSSNLPPDSSNVPSDTSNAPLLIGKHNPWSAVSKSYKPEKKQNTLNYNYLVPLNGARYGAFVIRNIGTSAETVSFKVSNSDSGVEHFQLFSVPYIPVPGGKAVADPLVPIKSGVKIAPGLTKMFFFELTGAGEGNANASIIVLDEGQKFDVNIEAKVDKLYSVKDGYTLNANVWAYLPHPMLKDRKSAAGKDLERHHINTVVTPTWLLLRTRSHNYQHILNYLHHFKGIKNILLFPTIVVRVTVIGIMVTSLCPRNGKPILLMVHRPCTSDS